MRAANAYLVGEDGRLTELQPPRNVLEWPDHWAVTISDPLPDLLEDWDETACLGYRTLYYPGFYLRSVRTGGREILIYARQLSEALEAFRQYGK